MTNRITVIGCLLAAVALACNRQARLAGSEKPSNPTGVPDRAEDAQPAAVGDSLPKIVLKTTDGAAFDLNAAVTKKPAVLVFFRGGWCPYCTRHLGELQEIEDDLVDLGYQVIAISPDRPEVLTEDAGKQKLKYRLLSDSEMTAARSLGLAFRLDDATVSKYKSSYGIDIEADSGQTHHLLPVPSVFLVGTDGVIRFAHSDPNYKKRLSPSAILGAAKSAMAQ